jgi:O-6-methylguanine DNA methyltransferase
MIHIHQFQTPLGWLAAAASDQALLQLEFADQKLTEKEFRSFLHRNFKDQALSTNAVEILEELESQIKAYFLGRAPVFDIPLAPAGTPFQRQVWQALLAIPFGTTTTYGAIAEMIGRDSASSSSRAVGNANARNPIVILIPCHRVVGIKGSLTGYAGGIWRKQALLTLEGVGLPFNF